MVVNSFIIRQAFGTLMAIEIVVKRVKSTFVLFEHVVDRFDMKEIPRAVESFRW